MLTPSYSELMEVVRQNGKLDPRVASRYTVVLAAAKRARQITEGAEPLTYAPTDRAVSIAVKEMNEGKLRVSVQEELMVEGYDRLLKDQYKYRAITALSKDDLREDLKDDYASARTYKLEDEDDSTGEIFTDNAFEDSDDADVEDVDVSDILADDDIIPDDEDVAMFDEDSGMGDDMAEDFDE